MEYKILCEANRYGTPYAAAKLSESVNKQIGEGWEPVGGIAVDGAVVFQAMIKRE